MNQETEYEEIIVGRDYSRIGYFLLTAGIISGGIYLYKNFKPIRTERKIITETVKIKKEIITTKSLNLDSLEKETRYSKEIILYFGYNQYTLDPNEKQKLQDLPSVIRHIKLSGHADSDGSEEYNMKLSMKRIESAFEVIIRKYPNIASIELSPMGEKNIIIENGQENKTKSRRVEITIR
ncbi:MAG: OmpA family protein [Bacteroidia bacterium]|nr:OmpA family protein [Bacteroidia bacterium]MDW8347819.1 OmpA family protein [Bacteroidia bacterium]